MIGEIKVVSGNRKRFVEYCHYFISEIDKSIKDEGANEEGTSLTVTFDTYSHPYCYEGVALITKTFKAKGFDIKYPRYNKFNDDDGDECYHYVWSIEKDVIHNEDDDFPF